MKKKYTIDSSSKLYCEKILIPLEQEIKNRKKFINNSLCSVEEKKRKMNEYNKMIYTRYIKLEEIMREELKDNSKFI